MANPEIAPHSLAVKRLLPLAVPLLLATCGKKNEFVQPPPPPVTIAHPDPGEVVIYREFPATVAGVAEVEIRARVRGELEQIFFEEGQQVGKNDPLFRIEQEPYEVARDAAGADLENAEASLELAQSRLNKLENANTRSPGAVSQLDLDIGRAEVKQAQAVVSQKKALLRDAEINLDYTTVLAPTPGRMSEAEVDVGNLVDGSQGTLLAHITDDSRVRVYFEVPERGMIRFLEKRAATDTSGLEALEKVRLTLADGSVYQDDEGGGAIEGEIDFVDSRVDPSTRTARVRAVFDNPDGKLASGLYGLIGYPDKFPNEEFPKSVVIPAAAVLRDLAGEFAWVVDDQNMVRRRGVETDTTVQRPGGDPDAVPRVDIIVTKGLSPEDRVIVAGLQRAREGAEVTPQMQGEAPPKPETPAGAPRQDD